MFCFCLSDLIKFVRLLLVTVSINGLMNHQFESYFQKCHGIDPDCSLRKVTTKLGNHSKKLHRVSFHLLLL